MSRLIPLAILLGFGIVAALWPSRTVPSKIHIGEASRPAPTQTSSASPETKPTSQILPTRTPLAATTPLADAIPVLSEVCSDPTAELSKRIPDVLCDYPDIDQLLSALNRAADRIEIEQGSVRRRGSTMEGVLCGPSQEVVGSFSMSRGGDRGRISLHCAQSIDRPSPFDGARISVSFPLVGFGPSIVEVEPSFRPELKTPLDANRASEVRKALEGTIGAATLVAKEDGTCVFQPHQVSLREIEGRFHLTLSQTTETATTAPSAFGESSLDPWRQLLAGAP